MIADALERLKPVAAADITSQDPKGCMENTRVAILKDLREWSKDPDAHQIFWLNGMAGTGKSAIARSFTHTLRDDGLLGGSFFCSRRGHADQAVVKCILPTLAYFLSRRVPTYKWALLSVLQETDVSRDSNLEEQLEHLLKKPVASLGKGMPAIVLVIDALDECSDRHAISDLLRRIVLLTEDLPLKYFITSRPEPEIRQQLESYHPDRILRLHNVEEDIIQTDLTHYITERLKDARPRIPIADSADWPSDKSIKRLVELSGKLFIYAFTATEYINRGDPVSRLENLSGSVVDAGKPLTKHLDDIYEQILKEALDPENYEEKEILATKRILTAILALREPMTISKLTALLQEPLRKTKSNLDRLRAVIDVPPKDNEGVVTTFHASFGDFLNTIGRAPASLLITLSDSHKELTNICILNLQNLHFNISKCPSSYHPNSEQRLASIDASLLYSCLHWPYHFKSSSDVSSLLPSLETVFIKKFLFWIEVLSATGNVGLASQLILTALTAKNAVSTF